MNTEEVLKRFAEAIQTGLPRARSAARNIAIAVAVLILSALAPATARADEVTFSGSTGGCFGAACTPSGTGQSNTATLLGLTYNGSIFSGTTSSGFLAIGNVANPPNNVNNLGSFTLNTTPAVYNGNMFTLQVTFTAPTGITGGATSSYTATLIGSVSNNPVSGGVFVNFDNTPQNFTFSNSNASGSFTFQVNDVSVSPGGTVQVSGQITSATQTPAVPEPMTLLLLSTGLAGLAAKRRALLRVRSADDSRGA